MKRILTLAVIATVGILSFSFANGSAEEQPAPESKQHVVIHLSHFTDDLHRCFMALKVANLMQSHGAQVTIFLDLEGVRLAERRQKLDLQWGVKSPPLSEYYEEFTEAGGKLVICPHCAKSARLGDMGLKKMAEIGTMKRIGEMLIEADKVMDY